nr:MAG TPA: hypothetical protein [Caudoviricetes sp.]
MMRKMTFFQLYILYVVREMNPLLLLLLLA